MTGLELQSPLPVDQPSLVHVFRVVARVREVHASVTVPILAALQQPSLFPEDTIETYMDAKELWYRLISLDDQLAEGGTFTLACLTPLLHAAERLNSTAWIR